ncbi:MAG: hypothetical protein CVU98_08820 [Firmicutes bacterium HGW-Firmicutes-3]|jgi:hypothetical protein|nr:MAG: hypothetical protein CVU98_08820 [Firmicutes bacterium HGW-Firmicutes-3]
MSLVYVASKKNGITYVYESTNYWDKEKKQSRSKRTRGNYHANYQLHCHTTMTEWNYSQKRPYKGDVIKDKRRMYLHIYYSGEKAIAQAEKDIRTI